MANFDGDILKDEEKLGGFGLGEPDDDSFSLKGEKYPGDIYRFIDKPAQEEEIIEPQDDIADSDEDIIDASPDKVSDSDEIDDPALIGYIQGLQSAMTMKVKKGNEEDGIEDTQIRDFEPIDDSNADTHIDITDMDLDKPSIALAEGKKVSIDDIDNSASKKKKKKEKKNSEDSEDKDDKKKIPLFIWLGVASLIVIVIGLGAYYQYFRNNNNEIIQLSKDSTKKKIEIVTENKLDSTVKKTNDTTMKSNVDVLDLAKLQDDKAKEKPQDSIKKDTKIVESKLNKEIKETEKKVKPKENTKSDLSKVTLKLAPKTEKPTQKIKEKPKKSDVASIKPAPNSEIREKAIKETYTTKKEPQYKFSNIENDVEGVYTVQIYSSPSKVDAELWLEKLKSRSINDGFISEQKIRDQVWYRVRFGNFNTRSEARTAALRLGFSQTWIDRVK